MYQVTFIRAGVVHAISTPNRDTAVMVHRITGRSRLWLITGRGQWQLVE